MSTPTQSEVPAEAAYTAARDRVLRMTDALIGAEARIVDLCWRLDAALGEIQELRARLRAVEAGEEGEGGGASDPVGYTGAVGQAD